MEAGSAVTLAGLRPTERGTTMDKPTILPAGDPFTAAPHHDARDDRPHACNDGWVTIGELVVDPETGKETEEYALYLCRKFREEK
jgi:hypothetical protein